MASGKVDAASYIRKDLLSIRYHGVPSMEAISAEVGIPEECLIKLNANENAYGTAFEVKEAISSSLDKNLHVYPDPGQTTLRTAIAKMHGVRPEQICCGAGSDDLLDIILRMFEPQSIVVSTPTFGMYKFLGDMCKSKLIDVKRKKNFDVDVPAVTSVLKENPGSVVFLPSPNNPTGNMLTEAEVRLLCEEEGIVVIDEAYIDFADDGVRSVEFLLPEYSNLIVTRTFSKWAGLAGSRCGYCIADGRLVSTMLAIKQPYNVNCAAEAGALAAIEHRATIMQTVAAMRTERSTLFRALEEFSWLRPFPSQANFVLCEVLGMPACDLATQLRKAGIIVRYFGTQGGDLANFIRISAGKPEHTQAVVRRLLEIQDAQVSFPTVVKRGLKDEGVQAVLFDMDGVLADVSRSYRAAIVSTAAAFGVTVTEDDVSAAKAAGNANNDWILTHRLISTAASRPNPLPSLEEVTAKFEELYQGTEGEAGLRSTESLVVNVDLLKQLSTSIPLAVVTGRPRSDCDFFLETNGIKGLFKTAVCMEDGPAKPAPDVLRLAMERLGARTAIMIGDTPDDLVAARACSTNGLNVLPIGAIPPGAEMLQATKVARLLFASGAGCVLAPGLTELVTLLKPQ